MEFVQLWPLWLLLLIPLLILLYFLKPKPKEYEFSSLMLWEALFRNSEALRPWEKWRKNLLLFFQILVLLLLILSLTSPYWKKGGNEYKQVLLVFDTSGSMQMENEKGETALMRAKKEANDYLDSLPSGTRITLASCDQSVTLTASNLTNPKEASEKIDQIAQTDLAGSLKQSYPSILALKKQLPDAQMLLFTDTPIAAKTEQSETILLQTSAANASVDLVRVGSDEDARRVLVRVTNHANGAYAGDLNLYGDQELLLVQALTLEAKESRNLYLALPDSFQGNLIQAELNEKDALAADNRAYDLVKSDREKKVLLLSEDPFFLEKALKPIDGLTLYKSEDTSGIISENAYDLIICDGRKPDQLPKNASLLYLNVEQGEGFASSGEGEGQMLTFESSPVTTYMKEETFGVNVFYQIKKPDWAVSFLQAGDYSAGFYGVYQGRNIGVLAFDLHQSDLPLQTEYPVLLVQLMDRLLSRGMLEQTSYVTGQDVPLYGRLQGTLIAVTDPKGNETVIAAEDGGGSYGRTDLSGVYQAVQEKTMEYFVVNYPTDTESVLAETQGTKEDQPAETEERQSKLQAGTDVRPLLLLLTLFLLGIEWAWYCKEQ